MRGKKPFGKKMRAGLVSALAIFGIGGTGALVSDILPKDPATDTQYITHGMNGGFKTAGPNISVSDQLWKAGLGMRSADDLQNEMMQAAHHGDSWRVRTLINHGVNVKSTLGSRALDVAAREKHADVMRVLLEAGGPELRAQNAALVSFANAGNISVVNFLLLHDRGIPQTEMDVALMAAVQNNDAVMTQTLLDWGADVKTGDSMALVHAATYGDVKMVALLISNGADPRAQGDQPLRAALARGDDAMATLINNQILSQRAARIMGKKAARQIQGYSHTLRINPQEKPPQR